MNEVTGLIGLISQREWLKEVTGKMSQSMVEGSDWTNESEGMVEGSDWTNESEGMVEGSDWTN